MYPSLRRGSRRVSYSNLEWAEVRQVSEVEDGRKTGDVGERDRVEVFCGKCGKLFWRHCNAQSLSHACCVSATSVRCVL